VHFTPVVSTSSTTGLSSTTGAIRPGDVVTVEVTRAAPHHLIADGPVLALRRTRSGDAWEARTAPPSTPAVGLGMPTVGAPAPLPEGAACR
jgi:tRNA-2-methylthio-N6-dimethylallyladenosine synthase